MAELTHPCIVDLREVLSNDRCVFMVMQYCPGGELYDVCARGDRSTRRRRAAFSAVDSGGGFLSQETNLSSRFEARKLVFGRVRGGLHR